MRQFSRSVLLAALFVHANLAVSSDPDVSSGPGTRYLSPEFISRYAHTYDPYGLASLLATQPGVALQSSGDPGGEDWVTFRGNPRDSSRMTLVLLDGVPLNGASNSTLEFNSIPLTMLHDITIYYGPLPARYGGYTSVVELRTKQASDRVETTVYGGTHDTYGGGFTASKSASDWGITFDLQAQETDGLEGKETIHRTVDDSDPFNPSVITEYPVYGNRDYQQVVPMVTAHKTFNDSVRLGLMAQAVWTKKHYADGHSQAEPDRPANREREFYNFGLSLAPAAGSEDDYVLHLYYKDEDHETLALDDEFVNYGEQNKSQYGARGHYGLSLIDNVHLRVGGEYNKFDGDLKNDTAWDELLNEIIYYDNNADFDSPYFAYQDNLDNYAIFSEIEYQWGERATFSAGVRHDDVKETKSNTSYQLAASIRLTSSLQLQMSGGETSRYPSLNEYNSALRDPTVLGPPIPGLVDPDDVARQNGKLEMETQKGGEIGLVWTTLDGALVSELVAFDYQHEGEIFIDVRTVPNNLDPSNPLYNVLGPEINLLLRNNRPTKDESHGAELAFNYSTENLGLYLNGTWNKLERKYSDGRSSHNQPFMPPEYYASAGAWYQWGRSKIDMEVDYRGSTDDSLQERGALPDVKLGSSTLVHLGYKFQVTDKLQLFARAYNLFDESYETFYGLPMVKRHITGGLTYRF